MHLIDASRSVQITRQASEQKHKRRIRTRDCERIFKIQRTLYRKKKNRTTYISLARTHVKTISYRLGKKSNQTSHLFTFRTSQNEGKYTQNRFYSELPPELRQEASARHPSIPGQSQGEKHAPSGYVLYNQTETLCRGSTFYRATQKEQTNSMQ